MTPSPPAANSNAPPLTSAPPSLAESTEPAPPVLDAVDARIAVGGAVALDALCLQTRGARVLLAGDAAPLLEALCGTVRAGGGQGAGDGPAAGSRLVAGTLRLAGADVGSGAHHRIAGLAPLDPPLPTRWTVENYLRWAARLSGTPRRVAHELARNVLTRLGLEDGRGRRIGTLAVAERRAIVLAQALVTEPSVLVAEAPLAGLEGAASAWLAGVLLRATTDRATVLSVSRLTPPGWESELVGHATDVCYFGRGRLLIHGGTADALGDSQWVDVGVAGSAERLAAELDADGIALRGGPQRFVALVPRPMADGPPTSAASRILAAAARAKTAVVHCVPVL